MKNKPPKKKDDMTNPQHDEDELCDECVHDVIDDIDGRVFSVIDKVFGDYKDVDEVSDFLVMTLLTHAAAISSATDMSISEFMEKVGFVVQNNFILAEHEEHNHEQKNVQEEIVMPPMDPKKSN